MKIGQWISAAALGALLLFPAHTRAQAPIVPDKGDQQEQILQYLDKTIDWYRSLDTLRTSPDNAREAVVIDDLQKNALKALAYGFDYARAAGGSLRQTADTNEGVPDTSKIESYEKTVNGQTAALQKQIDDLTRQARSAPGAQRAALEAHRDNLKGELQLMIAQQDLLAKVKGFLSGQGNVDKSFIGTLTTMEQAFPELKRDKDGQIIITAPAADSSAPSGKISAGAMAAAGTEDSKNPQGNIAVRENAGILAAIADFFPLWRKSGQIDALMRRTADLEKNNERLRADIRADLQQTVAEGKKLADDPAATPKTADFAALTAHLKALSAVVVPLGQQHIAFETCRTEIGEWHTTLARDFASSLCRLIIRLALLGVVILIPMGLSEVARRATTRYVRDVRRRRQLRTVRRLIVSTVIGLVVFLSLFSDLGSFATYAGLLTAGMAVALQNVLLSMFGYFFLLGRFGIRVGERVTINGVTGEVVEVGMLRIYVMEYLQNGPTGRMAVFPNLVFFQPAAFYKQVAGSNYAWHETVLTFAADTDQTLLRTRLMTAAAGIYADYQEEMRRQQAALETATHLRIAIPKPEGTLKVTESGLEFTLRYPIEGGREDIIDKRMNEALKAAIKRTPELKLITDKKPDA